MMLWVALGMPLRSFAKYEYGSAFSPSHSGTARLDKAVPHIIASLILRILMILFTIGTQRVSGVYFRDIYRMEHIDAR